LEIPPEEAGEILKGFVILAGPREGDAVGHTIQSLYERMAPPTRGEQRGEPTGRCLWGSGWGTQEKLSGHITEVWISPGHIWGREGRELMIGPSFVTQVPLAA
jgi:hypothetical protein